MRATDHPANHSLAQNKRPKLIVHVFPSFSFGGQQARLAALVAGFGSQFTHIVYALDGQCDAQSLFGDNANIHVVDAAVKKGRLAIFDNWRLYRAMLRTAKPDLLCTYNWGAIEAAIVNELSIRIPHIHHEDGFGPGENEHNQPMRRVLTRAIALRNSALIVPSRGLEGVAIEKWKLPKKRVRYIQNGIDLKRFGSGDIVGPRGDGLVRVGSVGALRGEKNYARLIRAAAQNERVHLTLVGDGPERGALEKLAQDLGMNTRVVFAGATAAPEQAYGAFDIFALSSDTEQAPISLMEAMCAGLPTLTTDVGDIRDMVGEQNKPFIAPLGDDGAYAAQLNMLVENAALRTEIGMQNAAKAARLFDRAQMVARYQELYAAQSAQAL